MKVWLAKRHWTHSQGYHFIWREATLVKADGFAEIWSNDEPANLLVGHLSEKLMASEILAGRLTCIQPTSEPRQ